MMKKILFILVLLLAGAWFYRTALVTQPNSFKTTRILTPEKTLYLKAEIADTPKKWTLGLMFRKSLPGDNCMIFLFDKLKPGNMWMKNTFIPLDMIFFDENFKIVYIHENAVPHDKTIITTPMPILGVIETNAGYVKKNNVNIGQKIIFPLN